MKIFPITLQALFVLSFLTGHTAWADSNPYYPSYQVEQTYDGQFSADELDELLAPIALYPDPLLAQILPAATFIDQIDLAARYVRQYGKSARIDDQDWDVSVKAVAHYPDVLFMMDQKNDWTVSLGQAFVNQQQDVMSSIQRLRAEAESQGRLVSTPEQQVVDDGGLISIDPAEPDMIYVPQYDPVAVYSEGPYPGYPFITFGVGFTIGAWLNRDCDWRGHRVYYHGWQGAGWISRSRQHIQVRNNLYINNRYTTVNINKKVMQHDIVRYREDIRHNVQINRERSGRTMPPVKAGQPAPASIGNRQPVRPDNTSVYRGRDIQRSQPVSQTGYGGYGSSRDATTYRDRGQNSRGNIQQFNRPSQAQRPSISGGGHPAQRPAVQQAPRPAPAGGEGRQHR